MATTELSKDYTERRSQQHTVTITINDDSIEVSPHKLCVNTGDSIQWRCDKNGTFTCEFFHSSPFPVKVICGVNASPPETVTGGPGSYDYNCSYTENDNTRRIDPIIIVDPSIGNTSKHYRK